MDATTTKTRTDVYTRVTSKIVEELERGTRPWLKPWNAEHAAGRITRPLRHNGQPYKGINILMLWAAAELCGFSCPYLAHLPASQGAWRTRQEGGARLARRLRQHVQEEGQDRRRRRDRAGDSVPQAIHRVQRRADRRLARAFLPAGQRAGRPSWNASSRPSILRQHQGGHPLRRQPGLLRPRAGLRPAAPL